MIVLSWDGVRHDFPERAETPALDRMARAGARASRLVPVFPTNTFPNHVSLATGTYVDRHGIVGNRFVDAERGRFNYSADASWIQAEPLWAAAERQGVRAAAFFWVGSETDWNGVGATYRKAPFDSGVDEATKVDQVLAWLDLPEAERPRLIMSWWHGSDHAAHEVGPDHSDVADALEKQDAQLGRLLEGIDTRGLWDSTTLLVVSDHGMAEVTEAVDVDTPLDEHGIKAQVVRGSGVAYVFIKDGARRAEALDVLDKLEGVRAYPSDGVPAELRSYYPGRSGDITVVAEPPHVIRAPGVSGSAGSFLKGLLGRRTGMHGYRPDHPDMSAVFYAVGRGVPAGLELGAMRAIDIAPTVAVLLDIDPPGQSEGKPIPGISPSR